MTLTVSVNLFTYFASARPGQQHEVGSVCLGASHCQYLVFHSI